LTGEFELAVGGRRLAVTHMAERVLAYLALAERPVNRTRLAGTLWLDASDRRAASNLRTVLWRLHRVAGAVVSADDSRLLLAPALAVDVTALSELAKRIIQEPVAALARLPLLVDCTDLLPDWDDDWVVADRERFRLLRLEALERAAAALLDCGRYGDALLAAHAAERSEPLRESVRRLVMRAHLAQGNVAEAIRSFRQYRTLLDTEFGIEPSQVIRELLDSWTSTG
jgi:DNA-binding SARP family transcriptional activator